MNHDRQTMTGTVLRLSVFILFMTQFSCEQYDDPLGERWYDGGVDERANAVKSGCEGKCSASCQCGWTEIGCKTDRDCQSGLYCKIRPQLGNRCLKKKTGDNDDSNNTNNDCHEFKPGHGQYCSSSCPCKEGEGDCDNDSQCKSGLVCKQQSGTDFCVKSGGSQDNDSGGGSSNGTITHVGSTEDYDSNGDLRLARPSGTRSGDLLILFLSRTDDVLPFRLSGWSRQTNPGSACLKSDNGQGDCFEENDCRSWSGAYCSSFRNSSASGSGRDLGTVVFYKRASSSEPSSYSFNLRGSHAAWAILTTLRGAATSSPFRSSASESCDKSSDSKFPSAPNGRAGDMLLLSQSFDDTVSSGDFGAPSGMSRFKWTRGSDEAGHVYGAILGRSGATGTKVTSGPGGPSCKDALITLVVKPN
jgi:hypothetical protein